MMKTEMQITPSEKNKDIIESYDLATLRDDLGLYGQRILLRLVEAANMTGVTNGLSFKNGDCRPISPVSVRNDLFGHTLISMPLEAIIANTHNLSKLTEDIEACMRHIMKARNGKDFIMFPFLTFAKCSKGIIEFEVREELWNVMLDFTHGFRKFELQTALKLKTKYSIKLYQIISGQREPLEYSIRELKEILGVIWVEIEEKRKGRGIIREEIEKEMYPLPKDFINRVIKPAQKELDAVSPYTFSYELIYSRKVKTGRPRISGIKIFPIYQPQFRDVNLEDTSLVNRSPGAFNNFGLNKEEIKILTNTFGLTTKGINNNFKLWEALKKLEASGKFLLLDKLDILSNRASKNRPDDLPKFVVGSLKKIVKDYGIDLTKK